MKHVVHIYRSMYNALSKSAAKRYIMQAIAVTLFVVLMALAPTLSNKYDLWVQEATTPHFFRIHPYLFALASAILIFCSFAFLIYATIREYRVKKRKQLEESKYLKSLESRIESLERK